MSGRPFSKWDKVYATYWLNPTTEGVEILCGRVHCAIQLEIITPCAKGLTVNFPWGLWISYVLLCSRKARCNEV